MSLETIRKAIDEVDDRLLGLLNERARLVHQVGEIKRAEGREFYAPEREEALLQGLLRKNAAMGGMLTAESIKAIYREIMSAALALETDLRIAYLGPAGTWTHQAAILKFGHSVQYLAMPNFADVFEAVARRRADYGVVPIENSTEGAVSHTLDLFAESPLRICAQILLPIENNLMAKGAREGIRRIYSHPQVFGQCRHWLHRNFPLAELVEVSSTTRAAELAAGEEGAAALAGKLAAELYGLPILEAAVQDSATNTTRFLVLAHQTCPPTGNDRTSLMFSLKDRPGSLHEALKPFNDFGINMSKIESRPSKKRDWEYFFFVDVLGHHQETKMVEALAELERHCTFVKILGSYPNTAS